MKYISQFPWKNMNNSRILLFQLNKDVERRLRLQAQNNVTKIDKSDNANNPTTTKIWYDMQWLVSVNLTKQYPL